MRITLDGAVDLHIHSGPCLFERVGDDVELARLARDNNMEAIMFKSHFEPTVSRAYHAEKAVPGIKVFGSIVLNPFVGGLNPAAVELNLYRGAKAVWLPTVYSKYHKEIFGVVGGFGIKNMQIDIQHDGMTILDEEGDLLPELKQVIKIIAKYDAILGTGHLSVKELTRLVEYAAEIKFKKVLITHPYIWPESDYNLELLQKLVRLGAMVEFCCVTVFPTWARCKLEHIKKSIDTLGAENCVISSDAGEIVSPLPTECLRSYAQGLHVLGLTEEQRKMLMITNPKRLLNI